MKLKDLKTTHEHSLTELLKILIFAIIMLAPFFAVLSKCLYVACNKNAYQNYSDVGNLDNVFYYAISQLGTQTIFSWTTNTGIYTTISSMTTGLGFETTNNTLAILLTYWALNTAVYITFDIVIKLFTKLTHLLA